MAVILYQIGIFMAIQIAAIYGKNSRNTAIVLISIFTLLQVFISWLLLLQFITILISYNISNNLFFTKKENSDKQSKILLKSYDEIGGRSYTEYDEKDNLSPEIRKKIECQKEIKKITTNLYENDPEYRQKLDSMLNSLQAEFSETKTKK